MALREFLYRHVTAIDITAALLIVLLVMGNVYFALQTNQLRQELRQQNSSAQTAQPHQASVAFMDLFIDRVLRAEGEIDFETRLKLESDVRELKDEKVLILWQNFTNAQTEAEAQLAVKELLGLLIDRIQGK